MNIFTTKIPNTWSIAIISLAVVIAGFLINKNMHNNIETPANSTSTIPSENTPNTNGNSAPAETKPISATPQELGFWVWGSPQYLTQEQVKSLATKIKSYGGTALYITIDDYLSILDEKDPATKTQDEKDFSAGLDRFITTAKSAGLVVDAESGDRDWVNPENRDEAWTLINFLKTYNDTHTNKFRNFQYDVEPYLMPEYVDDKAQVLENYVSFVDDTITHMQGMSMGLSVVLPDFYDSTKKWTPQITYKGVTKYAYSLILDVLDKRPGSSVIVMAYRNFATGDDGAIARATPEVSEASSGSHKSKIIIAQETGNVPPDYVTFYGKSKKDLFTQISTIKNSFKGEKAFAGIAVDYTDPFLKLAD